MMFRVGYAAVFVSVVMCACNGLSSDTPTALLQESGAQFALDFLQGQIDPAFDMCAPVLQKQLPKKKLSELQSAIVEQFGNFVKLSGQPRVSQKDQYYPVVVKCEMEAGQLDLQMTFDKDLRVAGLFYNQANGTTSAEAPEIDGEAVISTALKFTKEFWQGRLDSAYTDFSQIMKDNISMDDFRRLRTSVINQKGAFKSVNEDVKLSRNGGLLVAVIQCRFEAGAINLQLTFDKNLKIAGMFFV